ncbi:MAG: haloacid dehalogenase type II [Gammaproteobacteria bacterium]
MEQSFEEIRACVFDAYGTLFDVHSAVGAHHERLGPFSESVSAMWRAKQLEYTWLRSLMGRHADFWEVTEEALDYALSSHDVFEAGLRDDLMHAYLRLECYAEVPAALDRLRSAGMKLAILSNGSPPMLEAAVGSAGLTAHFDQVLSVESVGIYKPDPRVYRLATDALGVQPEQISFQSSNGWDIAGAASFGLRTVWINRFAQQRERLPTGPDVELKSLDSLPGVLGLGSP